MPTPQEDHPIGSQVAERLRFGGVRHDDLEYQRLDLGELLKMPIPVPKAEDWYMLRAILGAPAGLHPDCKAEDLQRVLSGILKANRNERFVLIRILSIAGVFECPDHQGYFDGYIHPRRRILPAQRFTDWGYPAIWWRARHGVRRDAALYWFTNKAFLHAV
jgi:hypothetical protein